MNADNNNFNYKAKWLRKEVLLSAQRTGGQGAHLGGTMSCIEILISLYYSEIVNFKTNDPQWEDRDRILIGKGHAHLALYHIWSDIGFFPKKLLKTYGLDGTSLGVQLDTNIPGSEYNTGSLGHVIGIGAGICISAKIDNQNFRVFTLIGDGECESGSIWESIKFALFFSSTAALNCKGYFIFYILAIKVWFCYYLIYYQKNRKKFLIKKFF